MPELTVTRRVATHVLLAAVLALPAARADAPSRVEIAVYQYRSIDTDAEREAFDDFHGMLNDRMLTLSDELAREGAEFAYLEDLQPYQIMGPGDEPIEFRGRLADLAEYWAQSQALQLLHGRMRTADGQPAVRSQVYLGELQGALPSKLVKLDLPVDPDRFEETAETHTALLLYALAMDAMRQSGPQRDRLVRTLLARTWVYLLDIPEDERAARELRAAVQAAFEAEGMTPP